MINDISTHKALKNRQNICKGIRLIRVIAVLPIVSSSAIVKKLKCNETANINVNNLQWQFVTTTRPTSHN